MDLNDASDSDVGDCGNCDNCECDGGEMTSESISPPVNLGGRVILVEGGNLIPPTPAPIPPPKVIPPEQQEKYLNQWNKPETRNTEEDSLFSKLGKKITALFKDLVP